MVVGTVRTVGPGVVIITLVVAGCRFEGAGVGCRVVGTVRRVGPGVVVITLVGCVGCGCCV